MMGMSLAELKQAVESLTPDERLELATYLRWRNRKDDPNWQGEIGNRLEATLAGQGHSQEELLKLHDRLSRP